MATEPSEKFQTIETMRRYGGGFVKALAEAYAKADAENSARIEKAFPEYIKKYGPEGEFPVASI